MSSVSLRNNKRTSSSILPHGLFLLGVWTSHREKWALHKLIANWTSSSQHCQCEMLRRISQKWDSPWTLYHLMFSIGTIFIMLAHKLTLNYEVKESIESPTLREFPQQLSLPLVLWWNLNYLHSFKVGCPICEAQPATHAPHHPICLAHVLGLKIHHTWGSMMRVWIPRQGKKEPWCAYK